MKSSLGYYPLPQKTLRVPRTASPLLLSVHSSESTLSHIPFWGSATEKETKKEKNIICKANWYKLTPKQCSEQYLTQAQLYLKFLTIMKTDHSINRGITAPHVWARASRYWVTNEWRVSSGKSNPSSVQFSHSVVSDSLRPHELQHARPPCPSPTPRVHSDSRPSNRWCHPAISSSVIPFSSCPQSLPALESFPMSQLFTWGGQSTGV